LSGNEKREICKVTLIQEEKMTIFNDIFQTEEKIRKKFNFSQLKKAIIKKQHIKY